MVATFVAVTVVLHRHLVSRGDSAERHEDLDHIRTRPSARVEHDDPGQAPTAPDALSGPAGAGANQRRRRLAGVSGEGGLALPLEVARTLAVLVVAPRADAPPRCAHRTSPISSYVLRELWTGAAGAPARTSDDRVQRLAHPHRTLSLACPTEHPGPRAQPVGPPVRPVTLPFGDGGPQPFLGGRRKSLRCGPLAGAGRPISSSIPWPLPRPSD